MKIGQQAFLPIWLKTDDDDDDDDDPALAAWPTPFSADGSRLERGCK